MEHTCQRESRQRLQTPEKNNPHCQRTVETQYRHSKTRLAEEGSLAESGCGYIFPGMARSYMSIECMELDSLSSPVSWNRFPAFPPAYTKGLWSFASLSATNAWSPSWTCIHNDVHRGDRRAVLCQLRDTPATDKLVILSDINARELTGTRNSVEGVIGREL